MDKEFAELNPCKLEDPQLTLCKSVEKRYALFTLPKRSVVKEAPFTDPLFPFPDASLALPQNGQYPTRPFCKVVGNSAFTQGCEKALEFAVNVVLSPQLMKLVETLVVMLGGFRLLLRFIISCCVRARL